MEGRKSPDSIAHSLSSDATGFADHEKTLYGGAFSDIKEIQGQSKPKTLDKKTRAAISHISLDRFRKSLNTGASAESISGDDTYRGPDDAPPKTSDPNKKALEAVREVGPRVYELNITGKEDDPTINFIVIGCQGSGSFSQRKVAKFIQELILKKKIASPDFVCITGDNDYPDGADTPNDLGFKLKFDDMYYPEFAGCPFFIANGNHDHRRHRIRAAIEDTRSHLSYYASRLPFFGHKLKENIDATSLKIGREVAINQSAHTYLPNISDPFPGKEKLSPIEVIEYKKDLFQQPALNTGDLSLWNQPHPFFSFYKNKVQFFILDSNTYLEDYLFYMLATCKGEKLDPAANQALWYELEYKEAKEAGRKVLTFFHHSLVNWGKRALSGGWDGTIYMSIEWLLKLDLVLQIPRKQDNFWELANIILTTNMPDLFNTYPQLKFSKYIREDHKEADFSGLLYQALFIHQNLPSDTNFTAHNHCIAVSYINFSSSQKPCTEFCPGAGGDEKLQGRHFFKNTENLGAYFKNYGAVSIECNSLNPKIFTADIHTFNQHMKLTQRKKDGYLQEAVTEEVQKLRQIILAVMLSS